MIHRQGSYSDSAIDHKVAPNCEGEPTAQQSSTNAASGKGHTQQLQALQDIVDLAELGAGRLDNTLLDQLRNLEQRAAQRLSRSREHVVIALAGGTGSGKSSLLNAIIGTNVSSPGVKRPTTDHAIGVSIGSGEEAAPLLDWLQVFERHFLEAEGQLSGMAGAVILDLPDIDSVVAAHWDSAERLIERCDLLIWVVDPLKYAHAIGHQRYLANLAHHAEVLVVTLNHADRLAQGDRADCINHLQQLLAEHGLGKARSLPASANTGEGVDLLRQIIAEEVRERRAPVERLRADSQALKQQVGQSVPDPGVFSIDTHELLEMQHEALNERDLLQAAAALYRRMAIQSTASPLKRMVFWGAKKLWRGVFGNGQEGNKLASKASDKTATNTSDHLTSANRPPIKISEQRLRYGLVDAVDHLVQRLPAPAAHRLREAAAQSAKPFAAGLRQQLEESLLIEPRRRWWWRSVALLRGVGELAALAGIAWLMLRSLADWLVLPPVPVPMFVGELGWPPVLIFGGISASILIGLAARPAASVGARRHSALLRRQISRVVESQAAEKNLGSLSGELDKIRQLSLRACRGAN
ncbi:50S ribosome-binding GTPase [Halorhodospira halochloris]|uniref:GTPase n=1 Tax=Halorhodospira halochloris TaxID=1052 RepID=UPI001EE943BF|nr:GTPase [Halorhodospira halochloris]MCG5530634.1 50S ribosome-binding GTPase [Halorhodospira halochloris]